AANGAHPCAPPFGCFPGPSAAAEGNPVSQKPEQRQQQKQQQQQLQLQLQLQLQQSMLSFYRAKARHLPTSGGTMATRAANATRDKSNPQEPLVTRKARRAARAA
ncbi:hypothetical protein, partial [Xanthomonas sacchari]